MSCALTCSEGDFPELVRIARNTLGDERYTREQAEQSIHAMIRAEATWLSAKHNRFNLDWVAGQKRNLDSKKNPTPPNGDAG